MIFSMRYDPESNRLTDVISDMSIETAFQIVQKLYIDKKAKDMMLEEARKELQESKGDKGTEPEE